MTRMTIIFAECEYSDYPGMHWMNRDEVNYFMLSMLELCPSRTLKHGAEKLRRQKQNGEDIDSVLRVYSFQMKHIKTKLADCHGM